MYGRVTVGSGGTANICNLKFANRWNNAPSCYCNNESQVLLTRSSSTIADLACSVAVSFGAGDLITYGCQGFR